MVCICRAFRFVLVVLLALGVFASPASAHTGPGLSSSNYFSKVEGIEPSADDVTVRLVEARNRVQLTAVGNTEVVIFGFGGEPYLRVGPDGTFENKLSPSVTLNNSSASRNTPVNPSLDPPEWKQTSDSSTLKWHDKRANFDSENAPNATSTRWNIPLKINDNPAVIAGSVVEEVTPNPVPKYLVAVALALLVTTALFSRIWRAALTAALVTLVIVDIEHSLMIALRKVEFAAVVGDLAEGFYAIAGWAMAAGAIAYLYRRKTTPYEEAYFFAIFAALVMGFIAGFADISDLSNSRLPVAGPPELTRWSVTLSIGLGVGIALGCLGRLIKSRRNLSAQQETNAGKGIEDHDGH